MSNERKPAPVFTVDVPATPRVVDALTSYGNALADLLLFLRENFGYESGYNTVPIGELQVRLHSRAEQNPTSYNASAVNELDELMRAASYADNVLACVMHYTHHDTQKAARDPASDAALFANTDCLDPE